VDGALAALTVAGLSELIDWRAREIFRVSADSAEYSLLLGTTFQAADRTLRDEELQSFSQRVIEAVGAVGGRLRT